MIHAHIHEPPPIGELRPDLPPDIAGVIQQALAKGPDQRFASAGGLAAAFKPVLAGQTTVVAPLHRKNAEATRIVTPLLVGGAMVFVLTLIGIVAILLGGQAAIAPGFTGDNRPVENITWAEARLLAAAQERFIGALSTARVLESSRPRR